MYLVCVGRERHTVQVFGKAMGTQLGVTRLDQWAGANHEMPVSQGDSSPQRRRHAMGMDLRVLVSGKDPPAQSVTR